MMGILLRHWASNACTSDRLKNLNLVFWFQKGQKSSKCASGQRSFGTLHNQIQVLALRPQRHLLECDKVFHNLDNGIEFHLKCLKCPIAATPYPQGYDNTLGMSNIFRNLKQIPRPYLWSIFSGILVGTSYIPFPGWAILFCYIPFWIAALQLLQENSPLTRVFLAGWLTQFILTLIGFNWVYYTASEFGGFNAFLSLMGLLLFAATVHVYIPIAAVIAAFLIRRRQIKSRLSQFFLMALTLALVERVWPSIFEWNLGYTLLWMKIPLYQWADMVGFWGLSTWILLAQAVLGYCWVKRREDRRFAVLIFTLLIGVLGALTAVGVVKEKYWSKTDSSIQFAVVQGNIGNSEKIQSEKKERFQLFILEIFANLTDQHLQTHPETEIILWPETALPFALDPYFHTRHLQQVLLQKVHQWSIPLVTGAYSQHLDRRDLLGYQLTSNSVFFLSPQKTLAAKTYNKSALLAFGEYMPFGEYIPFLYKLFPFVGVYERGPGPSPQQIELKNQKNIILGPQICYESLDSAFSRGLALKGSQVLFNVTNDSWFGWWGEPFQHNIMTLARAIEVRRPLVRATNTGISSAILANGTILKTSEMNTPWTHTFEVPYLKNPRQSFYTRFGHWDWILWGMLFIFFVFKGKYVRD